MAREEGGRGGRRGEGGGVSVSGSFIFGNFSVRYKNRIIWLVKIA